eukprot:6033104-Pleurochrysis_carterae.AAC.1
MAACTHAQQAAAASCVRWSLARHLALMAWSSGSCGESRSAHETSRSAYCASARIRCSSARRAYARDRRGHARMARVAKTIADDTSPSKCRCTDAVDSSAKPSRRRKTPLGACGCVAAAAASAREHAAPCSRTTHAANASTGSITTAIPSAFRVLSPAALTTAATATTVSSAACNDVFATKERAAGAAGRRAPRRLRVRCQRVVRLARALVQKSLRERWPRIVGRGGGGDAEVVCRAPRIGLRLETAAVEARHGVPRLLLDERAQ